MADLFITELDAITDFDDTDLVVIEKNPGGTPETNKMTIANVIAKYLVRNTYQISRTVASNNLTVAIKDSDGNDATAAKPLNFNINGTIRKLSGSLSVAVNAGVNTFNLGAAEFLNLDQELFVYIGYRASDTSVFVLLHRRPDRKEYADVSATATSENYGAYSGSAPAATDALVNIGRVNVRNSGTASFNWSVPAGPITINRPIFETSWLDWAPTLTGFSVNPTTLVNRYKIDYASVSFFVRQLTNGTSNATTFTLLLPFTAKTISNMIWNAAANIVDNGVVATTPGVIRVTSAATAADVFKDFSNAAFTNVNGKRLGNMGVLTYEI